LSKIKPEKNNQFKLEKLINIMKSIGFLTDNRVESAFRKIPRHEFVPSPLQDKAYDDIPLPIMNHQTISQPSVVSRMTEWLDVHPGHKILEIGTGSGWQTGILSFLVGSGKVYSIERDSNLVVFAKENLSKLAITNVEVILGDGNLGLKKESPFDRIILTATCKKIPSTLLEQLSTNGLLIAPVGQFHSSLILLKKISKGISEIKNESGYAFVPLLSGSDKENF
jgi:protein-L-isoaspartate(D-aspartate) O-methyltransferase